MSWLDRPGDLTLDTFPSPLPALTESEQPPHAAYGGQSLVTGVFPQQQQQQHSNNIDAWSAVSAQDTASSEASTFSLAGIMPHLGLVSPRMWDRSSDSQMLDNVANQGLGSLQNSAQPLYSPMESENSLSRQTSTGTDTNKDWNPDIERLTRAAQINIELYNHAAKFSDFFKKAKSSDDGARVGTEHREKHLQTFKEASETFFDMCFRLIDVLDEFGSYDSPSQKAPPSGNRNTPYLQGARQKPFLDGADSASVLVLASCYVRLLDTYADLLHAVAEDVTNSETRGKCLLWLSFPQLMLGKRSLDAYPRVKLSTVLELVMRTIDHIGGLLRPRGSSDYGRGGDDRPRKRQSRDENQRSNVAIRSSWQGDHDAEQISSAELPMEGIRLREERVASLVEDIRSQI